ncbi:MAG: hypothetical protein CME25_00255 [Gemmatimonadetes bacterium]|nr:hypothetical protein [Gemmatimonadota bacterium]
MSMLDRDRYVLLTILLCFAGSFVLYDHLPHLLPIHWGIDGHINRELPKDPAAYLYPGAMVLVFIFFRLIPFVDRNRVRQLREIGLYNPLRNGAVYFFAYCQILVLGIGIDLFSDRANILVGTASLICLFGGIHFKESCIPELGLSTLNRLGVSHSKESGRFVCAALLISGASGLFGTLTGLYQPLWLTLPLVSSLFLGRRRFPKESGTDN